MPFLNTSGDDEEHATDAVAGGPPVEFDPNDPNQLKVHYNLTGWSIDQRAELAETLAEREVPHIWDGEELVGGLYGVGMGAVFFGESMFSRVSDASKMALVQLCRFMQKRGSALIDCKVYSEHLESLGAREPPRNRCVPFLERPVV